MTSTECVGWEGECCWSFKSPCAPVVLRQSVSKRWMNKKTESHQLSEKGFVFFFCFFCFWTVLKAESKEVFSFLCCSTYPAIHSRWKTKPLHDPPWSRTPPESGGGLAKNWKPVFSSFFAFCWFLKSSWSVLTDPISLAALQDKNGGWRAAFWLFTWDLWRQPTFVWWCRTDAVTSARSNFACFVSIDCTDFFQRYLCIFFYSKKKKRKNTKKKKS